MYKRIKRVAPQPDNKPSNTDKLDKAFEAIRLVFRDTTSTLPEARNAIRALWEYTHTMQEALLVDLREPGAVEQWSTLNQRLSEIRENAVRAMEGNLT